MRKHKSMDQKPPKIEFKDLRKITLLSDPFLQI